MSGSSSCFWTCIQISQEAGRVVWYSHPLKNSPVSWEPHGQRRSQWCRSRWKCDWKMAALALRLQGGRNHRSPRVRPALILQDHVWVQTQGEETEEDRRPWICESMSRFHLWASTSTHGRTGNAQRGPWSQQAPPTAEAVSPCLRQTDRQRDGAPQVRRP